MILSIEFLAFDIDFDPVLCDLNCNCDHLTITDGDGTTLMGKSCGSTSNSTAIFEGRLIGSSLPPAIVSRSNSISIVFKTGSLGSKSGWKVNWKAVAPGKGGLLICFSIFKMEFCPTWVVSGTSSAQDENLRPLLIRNMPLISGKYGLRDHF